MERVSDSQHVLAASSVFVVIQISAGNAPLAVL